MSHFGLITVKLAAFNRPFPGIRQGVTTPLLIKLQRMQAF